MGSNGSSEIEIFAEGELEAELRRHGGAGNISVKKLIKKGYDDVVRTVIRPTRAVYSLSELGASEFPLLPASPAPAPAPAASQHHGHGNANNNITVHVMDCSPSSPPSHAQIVRRRDFELPNDRGLQLRCSHWQLFAAAPDPSQGNTRPLATPCLVYLHSNMGSRRDALRVLQLALARGFSVLAFDFSGSGLSDGIYVTMGWNESKDLHAVLQYLDQSADVTSIALYAHSMGTFPAIVNTAYRAHGALPVVASASPASIPSPTNSNDNANTKRSIFSIQKDKKKAKDKDNHKHEDSQKIRYKKAIDALPALFRHSAMPATPHKRITGLVLDGAYARMSTLTEELMLNVKQEGFKVPMSLLKLATKVVQQSVKKRADVDLDVLCPIEYVEFCGIPALFLAGDKDRYVDSHHSQKLSDRYAGPTVLRVIDGDHYSLRSEDVYRDALDFLLGARHSVSAATIG